MIEAIKTVKMILLTEHIICMYFLHFFASDIIIQNMSLNYR